MSKTYNILIFGASYGSLLGAKLAAAGNNVRLICLPAEADLINEEGARVLMPVRGREGLVEINTRRLPGRVSAGGTNVDPAEYDLVVLAMQEPQYASPGVRETLAAVAKAKGPCMSIMNMPPVPYLARISALDVSSLTGCYTDASVWEGFDPSLMTLCSPDAQAFRPPEQKVNVLQVRLPTNFRSANFEAAAHTAMLRDLEAGIDAARFDADGAKIELPVKLRVHDSIFVPLAKWSMLLSGNYRCVQQHAVRPIRDAVHSDISAARAVYDWVADVCKALGAKEQDLVPFDKYASAALMLTGPSSAARALAAGARNIERVDRLVQTIGRQKGMQNDEVDRTVALVDDWVERNRRQAA